MSSIPSIFAILLLCLSQTTADVNSEFHHSLSSFSRNSFSELVQSDGEKSLIYSPFSIQACLSMVRMGADGQTAAELDRGLSLDNLNPQTIADSYHSILAKYENSNILKIANKVYVMQNHELTDTFKEVLANKFYSPAENIDFAQSENAASAINSWVESKTDNMITDLVSADTFNADTRVFLLSAIYFDGKWESGFPKEDTHEADFHTDETNTVKVQMMQVKSSFQYRYSRELDAVVVRLPYKDSNISMLIILPTEYKDLNKMQLKLKTFSLSSIVEKMKKVQMQLRLPKFKAESKFKLNDVLQKMGMKQMFVDADLGKMLKSPESLAIAEVIHKAVIEVSEEGTKAAAATGVSSYLRVANPFHPIDVDHPFFYAIIDENAVPLFQGTFVGV